MLTVNELSYDNLIETLLSIVPEIRAAYETEKEWMGSDYDSHPHLVFAFNLNPYIEALLMSDGDDATLRRIFQFLEAMANSGDDQVQNVLGVTVCEHLSGNGPELLTKARVYMGDATRQMSHEIAVGWGHEPPYDDDPPEIKAMAPSLRPSNGGR